MNKNFNKKFNNQNLISQISQNEKYETIIKSLNFLKNKKYNSYLNKIKYYIKKI